jgi:chaperonin cofactor prefoldin
MPKRTTPQRQLASILTLVLDQLHHVNQSLERIIMDQKALAAELVALKAQNDKSRAEIVAKIAALEAALGNAGGTTAEVDAALAALKGAAQALDDLNPDAPVTP